MDISILKNTFNYVSSAPYFWQSLGFTSAIFMFIGGIIYDGRVEEARKGIITIGAYIFMLVWMTIVRVNDRISNSVTYISLGREREAMAFAGICTILFVTMACLFGIVFGVYVARKSKTIKN